MTSAESTVLVLLAAGRSQRFGAANKLEQDFLGQPLGLHVATALEGVPFRRRIAVTDGGTLDYAARHFDVVHNPDPTRGMASSLRLGVTKAQGADAVLIALADMPRVTAAHVYRLLDAADADADGAVVMSSDGVQPMPPGVFGKAHFDTLLALEGDRGARDLIRAARHVVTSPAELVDIDTPQDLERLRSLVA